MTWDINVRDASLWAEFMRVNIGCVGWIASDRQQIALA